MISTETAEHHIWDEASGGWYLLKRDDISVIQERVPAGGAEVMHYHEKTWQFFYVLEGRGTMILEDREITLENGKGIEIEPMVKHQFKNHSQSNVRFLVISVPSPRGDRINL